jgi:hypothetical protein
MGSRFAAGVADGLRAAAPVDAASVEVAVSEIPLELDPFPPVAELERQLGEAAATANFAPIVAVGDALVVARRLAERRRARVTAIALGPELSLVVLPGEVFLEHGLAIRAGSPFANTVVASYNDNTLQYVPTAAAFPDGEYEVTGGWRYIRAGEGERLAAEGVRLLNGLGQRRGAT